MIAGAQRAPGLMLSTTQHPPFSNGKDVPKVQPCQPETGLESEPMPPGPVFPPCQDPLSCPQMGQQGSGPPDLAIPRH